MPDSSSNYQKQLAIWSPRPDAVPVEKLGDNVVVYGLPVIKIVALDLSARQRQQLLSAQALLFISHHAVTALLKQIPVHRLADKLIVAIGKKTAGTLTEKGIVVNCVAKSPFSSEQLLNDNDFQQLSYQCLALVCGVGGRQLLQQTIQSNGKKVVRIECYRRDKAHYSGQFMLKFLTENKIGAVIVSSCGVADVVLECLKRTARDDFFDWPLFVLSPRIGNYAKTLGFSRIIVSPQASQQALSKSILTWWSSK